MKLRYYMRGLGIGVLVTAILMSVTIHGKTESLTDEEIIARAKELGMEEKYDSGVLADTLSENDTTEAGAQSDGISGILAAADADDKNAAFAAAGLDIGENTLTVADDNSQNASGESSEPLIATDDDLISENGKSTGTEEGNAGSDAAGSDSTQKTGGQDSAGSKSDAAAADGKTTDSVTNSSKTDTTAGTSKTAGSKSTDSSASSSKTTGSSASSSKTDTTASTSKTTGSKTTDSTASSSKTDTTASTSKTASSKSTDSAAAGNKTDTAADSSKAEVTITVNSGDGSQTVARKLANAGVISDAAAYDKFLCSGGYDKKICTGTHTIPAGATDEEIAKIITTK
jgi:hypothetical protein